MPSSDLWFASALAVALGASSTARAASAPPDSAQLLRQIERLGTVGNVLYVAAHPDDENTRLLAWLVNDRKVHAAYLSLTRGEGGQNLLGPEQAPLLGLIRTQELLAARGIDTAEQLFGRERDFGYSKSSDETLGIWGHDAALSDVVWAIRRFRPDVIVTRFSPDDHQTHGHHTARSRGRRGASSGTKASSAAPSPRSWSASRRSMWAASIRFSVPAPVRSRRAVGACTRAKASARRRSAAR
jgi:LmbE family N-acetylglucosaminyl deacetylase